MTSKKEEIKIKEREELNKKNKIVAGVLAIFLGVFGIQYFYLQNNVGIGIVMILFCWTGIPTIIGFFHGISLLCMTDKQFDERYN